MCIIQSGYFTVNGSSPISSGSIFSCKSNPDNQISVACNVSFSSAEIGKQYKAELKVKLPTGSEFSFFTGYKTVSSTETFSTNLVKPAPLGTYCLSWIVIYDLTGKAICSSNGEGLSCKSITITTGDIGTPVTCPSDQISILGNCISKPILLIVGALVIYMMVLD